MNNSRTPIGAAVTNPSEMPTRLGRIPSLPILLGLLLASCLPGALRAQVIGYWQFNEKTPGGISTTNAGVILDSSGNGYNGTTPVPQNYVAGCASYSNTPALQFNMTNSDYVDVPDPSSAFTFSSGQSFTLETVVQTTDSGQAGIGCIVGKVPPSSTTPQWWWRVNAGKSQFLVRAASGEQFSITGTTQVADGNWHHLAAVYDSAAQQLLVYVDYVLDASLPATFSSGGAIGTTQDLAIGAFPLDNNRYFDGNIDFVRITAAALTPANFVQASTAITGYSPANGNDYVSPASTASFSVVSSIGVPVTNISVTVNGSNIVSQLAFSGNNQNRTVTLPPLVADAFYNVNISVQDAQSNIVTAPWKFSTLVSNIFSFEAEDYNFNSGQFIDNPLISSYDSPSNYFDRLGVQGIDFNQLNTPNLTLYRIGDQAGTALCPDAMEPAYIQAQISDPGVTNYMVVNNMDTEWLNYTRTFPTGTYRIYARLANPGLLPAVMRLDEVTSGSTTASQTIAPIGSFINPPTASASSFAFVPLTDALGQARGVSFNGVDTLRLTFVSAGTNVNLDYFILVPNSGTQVPFLASISPAAGAGNVVSNATIQASIRNADTSVNTASIHLQIDGTNVTPTVTPMTFGANVSYTPANMALGVHTATLTFTDSAAASVTNQWQFSVASQAVFGYWKFNEGTPGNYTSTNAGSILDASGNGRNGTANDNALAYVNGSFNYGNTPALQFNGGVNYVDVPDTSGVFTFTNSFTFEAVVLSTNTATTTGAILAKNGTTDGEGEYWWRLPGAAGGVQRVALGCGTNEYFVAGTKLLNDGNWHHVAVVYDAVAGQVSLYADYVLDAVATNISLGWPIGRPTDLFLGSFNGGGSDFNGNVDFIRISNGALTTNQFVQTSVALGPLLQSTLPANGAKNVAPGATIQAVYLNRSTSVALSSMKLFVDGVAITSGVTTSFNGTSNTTTIAYAPTAPLAAGAHAATVTYQDTAIPANNWTNTWNFTTLATLPVVAFYQFNEQPAGGVAGTNVGAILDSGGNGYNGQTLLPMNYVAGSAAYGSTPALAFNMSSSNYVDLPDPSGAFNFPTTQSITLEALVQTTNSGLAGVGCIIGKVPTSSTAAQWWWRISSGKQGFLIRTATTQFSVSGTTALADGNWHHLAAVYDASAQQMRLYADSVLDASLAAVFTSGGTIGTNQDAAIGAFPMNNNRYFNGNIDYVRMSAAALDTSWFVQPSGAASPVSLFNTSAGGGNFSFRFAAQNTGHSYVVQSSSTLGTSAAWTNLETISGSGSTISVTNNTGSPSQFFRVIVQ